MNIHIVDVTNPFLSFTLWLVVICVLATFYLAIKASGQLRSQRERTLFKAACFMFAAVAFSLVLGLVAITDFLIL